MKNPDPYTAAVVMATGAVAVGALWFTASVAVVVSRTVGARKRMKAGQR